MRSASLCALVLLAAMAWILPTRAAETLDIPLGLDAYMPIPEDNPLTAEKVELGRRLSNDKRLSRDETIACATSPTTGRSRSASSAAKATGGYRGS